MYFKPKRYPIPKPRPFSFKKKNLKESLCYGIKSKSEFLKLKSFKDCNFFGLDIMHLFSGIAKQFWKLLCGKFGKKNNPLFLTTRIRNQIGASISNSKSTVPSTLDACTANISKRKGLKSIEWINMLRFITPTIIIKHIKDHAARKATLALVQVCSIAFQKSISNGDLRKLNTDVWTWFEFLIKQVDLGNISGKIFTINQHYLRHLKEMIVAMGPPSMYSTFANERALGEIKRKVKSPSAPGTNAGNIMVGLVASRFIERRNPSTTANNRVKALSDSTVSNSPEIWSPHWNGTIHDYAEYNLGQLLRAYWQIHLENVGAIDLVIEAGARLFVSSKEVIGSSYRERSDIRRDDFYVQMIVDVDKCEFRNRIGRKPRHYFGEVIMYFRHKQGSLMRILGLVKVWKVELTVNGIPYIKEKGDYRYAVVSSGDIRSMIALYTATSNRRYIVYPHMKPLNDQELGKLVELY